MLRFLIDENVRYSIVLGLSQRHPAADIVHVRDVGLRAIPDPQILEWAAAEERVLLTHDRDTMPGYVYDRIEQGLPVPGVIVIDDHAAEGHIIEDMGYYIECGEGRDCRNQVVYLPWPR